MIVTLAVQAVASLLALRGSNLLWGVRLLLTELDPDKKIQEEANAIAEAALRHPLVSDSIGSTRRWLEKRPVVGWFARRWTLATAVREEELVAVLNRLTG